MPPTTRTRKQPRAAGKLKRKVSEASSEDDADDISEVETKKRKQYDSDDLDDDLDDASESDEQVKPKRQAKAKKPVKKSPRKKKKADIDELSESELKEGQEIVGVVVTAPTTGLVPPGQISQNTLDFLKKLQDPACNDREWFHLHDPVYRVAEKEWKSFIEALTDTLIEVDPQLPPLPPKDVIHRIYRDVRFSNDKTPYKKNLSASFSRSGRKGIFAHYHVSVKPGNESCIAAGLWCPGRAEIANVRTNLQRSSKRFKRVISSPDFIKFFGKAEPHSKGKRQNIFGHEDELKVAPKGVPKNHQDIDILKCRSFAVLHHFTDSEVLDPKFRQTIAAVAQVLQPFIHILNELLTVGGGSAVTSTDDEESDHDNGDASDEEE